MNPPELPTKPACPDEETGVLAREIAKAFRGMVQFYERSCKLSHEEALQRMGASDPAYLERILTTPPEEIGWLELDQLAADHPEKAQELWEQVKQAAREELRSGHRMATTIEVGNGKCWPRAQFLALREEILEGWKPANALERQLVETLAQSQAAYLHWLETLTTWTSLEYDEGPKDNGTWRPPRVAKVNAIEQAAAMVDRFHRIMMRTLRALRDMRRYAPKIVVQNAGQVNVGEQQVNVSR
jgi:hypothetical protein